MLSNETTRVRPLDFKEKTANTEPVIKEKTNKNREEDRRRADGSTSTEEIDGEEVIKEVHKNKQQPHFNPTSRYYAGDPLFLQPVRKGAACVCRDCVISMHCVVEFHVM